MENKMIYAQEQWINATEGYSSGDSGVYETFTDSIGELFRSCQHEHGRCISSMYMETENKNPERIGWVFEKKRKYTDTNEEYLCETWVSLHKSEPVTTTKYDYLTN